MLWCLGGMTVAFCGFFNLQLLRSFSSIQSIMICSEVIIIKIMIQFGTDFLLKKISSGVSTCSNIYHIALWFASCFRISDMNVTTLGKKYCHLLPLF